MGLLILGLILFVCLVLIHEYGHYLAAKRGGVVVEEFGLGFPPKVWGKRLKSKMLLSINLLPIGGFVRLKGEHDADTTKGSYGAAGLSTKVKIMTAGVIMNLLVALGILTLLALVGMPRIVDNQFKVASDTKIVRQEVLVGYVEADSPAESAGVQSRDQLISISNGTETQSFTSVTEVPDMTRQFAGQEVVLVVEHDGQLTEKTVMLRSEEEIASSQDSDQPKGYLGVVPTEYVVQRSTWSAPVVAVGTAAQFTDLTLRGIGTAISSIFTGNGKQAADQVSGPVGIFVVIRDGASLGYQFTLMIIAVISLTLAIMNILPIPALDGGRLFVTLFFKVIKKPLTPRMEERIHGTGFVALLALFLLITIIDVRRFF